MCCSRSARPSIRRDDGNIGPVAEALQAESGDTIVLVTPAFPETGRTVYQGNLFVGAVPLNESPLKDHPLNPMHDANLVRVLAEQSRSKVGLVNLASVAKGADAIRTKLAELAGAGVRMAIIDAVFDPDLETIGLVALDHQLSVGASGIGLGLARGLVTTGRVRATPAGSSLGAPVGGPAACLAGSCSQATLAQIARAEAAMPVLRLDPEALISDKAAAARALDWATERLAKGPVLIASSSSATLWPRCRRGTAATRPDTRSSRRWRRSAPAFSHAGCGGWWWPAAKRQVRWWIS